MRIIKTDD